ncbi:MAG: hypothetical protein J1F43_08070 [Muribaculaceae bacterium]|nr:hypothetical protein [Muribaculaceae bacterium]
MNISPVLLLSIGATFALLYGLIITIGWAITRKNRRQFHQSVGLNEFELYDLQNREPLNMYVNSVSLSNNNFSDENEQIINPEIFNCYIVENESSEFPKIKKGYLIFVNRQTNEIEYAFNVPSLKNCR